jgi:hypothetical protein
MEGKIAIISRVDVDGAVRTHGAGIPPLEQPGVIDDLKICGGLIGVDGGD